MMASSPLYCDACGAANQTQATLCWACGRLFAASSENIGMEASLPHGAILAGRYRILANIGAGGYGTVYKARDKQHGLVAIKSINMAALSTQEKIEVTDTFNREITLLSTLRHKNLPRIYDHFTDPDHWYVVIEYIEGQTLEDLLARSRTHRMSAGQVANIGASLCDTLGYLHNQDPPIIFRDVKPANIMLTPWGQLYLIDFGIARRYRVGQLKDTGPLGSPGYAAPEQYGRSQTSTRTDIYGLGATLQTLLTGKEPLEIRVQGLPPKIVLPLKLQKLIIQMMDQDPAQRPSNMEEVKQTLGASGTNSAPFNKRWLIFLFLAPYYYFVWITSGDFSPGAVGHPFLGMLGLLIPVFVLGYIIYSLIRACRLSVSGLTPKALLLVAWKQMLISFAYLFIAIVIISNFLDVVLWHHVSWSLLIALGPTISGLCLLWPWLRARGIPSWLSSRRKARTAPAQSQTQQARPQAPMQQQIQRRP